MPRLRPFLLAVLLLASTLATAREISVGVYQNEPKIFRGSDGQPSGIFGELLQRIAASEGWTVRAVPCEWNDCLLALQEGRIELLPDVAYTEHRASTFDFHRNPVLHSWSKIYRRKGASIVSMLDLQDQRVAVLDGSVQQEHLASLLAAFGVNGSLLPVASMREGFERCARGEVDAVAANRFFGDANAANFGVLETPLVFLPAQLHFATAAGHNPELLAAIDRHLARWQANPDSVYYEVLARWLETPTRTLVPPAFWWGLAALLALLLVALANARLLQRRVAQKTEHLRDNEAKLETILNGVDAFIYIKGRDLRYQYANRKVCELFGRPLAQIIDRDDADFFDQASAEALRNNDRRVLEHGERVVEEEFNRSREGGAARTYLSVKLPLRDAEGRIHALCGISTDITEHQRAEQRYGMILRTSMDAFVVVAANARFVEVNRAACELSGYERAELLTMGLDDVEAAMSPAEIRERMADLTTSGSARFDTRWRRRDGEIRDVEVSVNFLDGDHGGHFFAFVRDITERKLALARIEYLAHHDALTGQANKLLFQHRFARQAQRAERAGGRLALIYLDLDNFKSINDTLGHRVGDTLLKCVSGRLGDYLGGTDRIGRIGGDEFILLIGEAPSQASITRVAEGLLQQVAEPMLIDGHELSTTASAGISIYPDDGTDFDTLFKNADLAVFAAKAAGRNTFRFFAPAMNADTLERLHLLHALRGALARNELVLHYQPQIALASGEVIGVEALIRWQHPELGLVAPARFIPLAEDSGVIVPIGAWVLQEACRQMVAWREAGLKLDAIAVNLSAVQFHRADFHQTVADALSASGLDAQQLELELTESILIRETEAALSAVGRLKALGLKLSIDDFGTGYSSLSYLKRFKVDKLKIDQSFIRGIDQDSEDRALVLAIIQMARSLGLRTVAEGVEEAGIAELLRSFGCEQAQGYLFGRPMAADALAAFLAAQQSGPPGRPALPAAP